jgi:hypothetical protein
MARPMPDLELEALQRSVHLADYARSVGYEPRPRDSTRGVTVLEHPQTRDCIAVARAENGQWIFASLPYYTPRGGDEPAHRSRERLRDCIARTPDQGWVVEFVQHCERVTGRREPSLDEVRDHLRAWEDVERARIPTAPTPLRGGAPPEKSEVRAPSAAEPTLAGVAPDAPLDRRMGDRFPSLAPLIPNETEVQERLRRWQEAQRAIDLKLGRPAEHASPRLAPPTGADSRGVDTGLPSAELARNPGGAPSLDPAKRALGQRRYDWSPPVDVPSPLGRTVRDRGSDRGR